MLKSQGLSSGLNTSTLGSLGNLSSVMQLDPATLKAMGAALMSGNSAGMTAGFQQIAALIQAKVMPVVAPVAANYLADAVISKLGLDPATSAQLKPLLVSVITDALLQKTTPTSTALKAQLIAKGIPEQLAGPLASGLAPLMSQQVQTVIAKFAAGLLVDQLGSAIGIPITPAMKAQLVAMMTPMILKLMQGMTNPSGLSSLSTVFAGLIK